MNRAEREFRRRELRFTVQVVAEGRVCQSTSRDMSMGGICLVDCARLPVNQPVKLFVALRDHLFATQKLIFMRAVPVWQDASTVGLRFCDLPIDVKESISEVVPAGLDG